MSSIYENVKAQLSMTDVLTNYGIKVNRGDMCLCPFHTDKRASCKVYNDEYIHCFGCGEHHDVISFTAKFFDLSSQYEAVKKLNQDFHLGFDIDASLLASEKSDYMKKAVEKKLYASWEKAAWETLRDWRKLLVSFKEEFKPTCPEEYNDKFNLAITELPLAETYLEEFSETAYEKRKEEFKGIVEAINSKLKRYTTKPIKEKVL